MFTRRLKKRNNPKLRFLAPVNSGNLVDGKDNPERYLSVKITERDKLFSALMQQAQAINNTRNINDVMKFE